MLIAVLGVAVCVHSCELASQDATLPIHPDTIVVHSQQQLLDSSKALRLSQQAILTVSGRRSPGSDLFRVAGAVRLSDGLIVVAEGSTQQLLFYRRDGQFQKAVGRSGDGPGEFRSINSLWLLAGDTIVVGSAGNNVTWLTSDGAYVRRLSLASPFRRVVAVLQHGKLVVVSLVPRAPAVEPQSGVDSAQVDILREDGRTVITLGRLPTFQVAMGRTGPRPPWFGAEAVFAARTPFWYYGFGSDFEIRVYTENGDIARVLRRRFAPRAVTRDDIDGFVKEWGKRWLKTRGLEREKAESDLRAAPYAASVPAFSQFLIDPSERLWVREANLADAPRAGQLKTMPLAPSTWNVFDISGRWLCTLSMPARFQPTDIGLDYVLGISQDEEGIESVQMFRIITPRS